MKIEIKQLSRIGSPKWVQACMKHTVQPICFADPWGKDDYSLNDIKEKFWGKKFSMSVFTFQLNLGFIIV